MYPIADLISVYAELLNNVILGHRFIPYIVDLIVNWVMQPTFCILNVFDRCQNYTNTRLYQLSHSNREY